MLFVGLDVGLDSVSAAVLDTSGQVLSLGTLPNDATAVQKYLRGLSGSISGIAIEPGAFYEHLCDALSSDGVRVHIIESYHAHAFMSTRLNKTDANDAVGLAEMLRLNHFKPVHLRSEKSRERRALLLARKLAQSEVGRARKTTISLVRQHGLLLGAKLTDADLKEAVERTRPSKPQLHVALTSLGEMQANARLAFSALDKRVTQEAENDPVTRLLMTAPGVGPVCALTFAAVIDEPERFRSSSQVGAYLGLTPRARLSGQKSVSNGRISRWGNVHARTALFISATILMSAKRQENWLKTWALEVRARRGYKKAVIATARRLSCTLHQIWVRNINFEDFSTQRGLQHEGMNGLIARI